LQCIAAEIAAEAPAGTIIEIKRDGVAGLLVEADQWAAVKLTIEPRGTRITRRGLC